MFLQKKGFDGERMKKRKTEGGNKLRKPSLLLMLLGWFLAWRKTKFFYKFKLDKSKMKGIKPPYLVFPNHSFEEDYYFVVEALRPIRANYVTAINQYIGRQWVLPKLGVLPKRQFISDTGLVKAIMGVIKRKGVFVIFPEAKYNLDGTLATMPSSLGKLVKHLGVTVVHINMHGNSIGAPTYDNTRLRKVPHIAKMYPILTKEQIQNLTAVQVQDAIVSAMQYNDYEWQFENNILVKEPFNAEGLHNLLYICPNCKSQCKTTSHGITLGCEECGESWTLTQNGKLKANRGETIFDTIPKWNAWQRSVVRQELLDGTYKFCDEVRLEVMDGYAGYKDAGHGKIIHDVNGIIYEGTYFDSPLTLHFQPLSTYTCAVSLGKEFDISTQEQTYYFYPKNHAQQMIKICLAVEELYKIKKSE